MGRKSYKEKQRAKMGKRNKRRKTNERKLNFEIHIISQRSRFSSSTPVFNYSFLG
jgi:hypothetical protein